MREYVPNEWEVLMIIINNEVTFRLAAGWQGGYTYGRSWKISSSIQRFEIVDNRIKFYNSSGSLYICDISWEGLDYYTDSVVGEYITNYAAQGHSMEKIKFNHFAELFLTIDSHGTKITP